MSRTKQTDLTATSLKNALWETLKAVKDDSLDHKKANSVATQAREILRTARTQLLIIEKAKKVVSKELTDFAMK